MVNVIKRMFQFVLTIQIVFLFIFIVENINNLSDIAYAVNIGGDDIEFTLNIYSVLAIMIVIFVIVLVSSLSILGGGLNDEGTKNLGKFLGLIMLYVMTNLATNYYLLHLAEIGIILLILTTLVYVLYAFNTFISNAEGTE